VDPAESLIRLAVFGSPIKHSLSPRIHGLFADQAGLEVDYRAVEVSEDFLSREVQKLVDEGGRGANITMPLKYRAFRLANRASERASVAQSANTLIFRSPTQWYADSTDGPGLLRDLARLNVEVRQRRIAVLGAGGAAAAVLYDLLQQDPAVLVIFNRSPDKAEQLASRFSEMGPVTAGSLENESLQGAFDLVINATSAGHLRETPPLQAGWFSAGACCYDMAYGKAHEPLAAWCAEQSIQCHDGLGMLVEQAAESFYLWTGFRADTAPVLSALRA
jgi:shikimate dehydrogenase